MSRLRAVAGPVTVVALVLALAVAVALGDRAPSQVDDRAGQLPAVTPTGAASSAWYCAAGTSDSGGRAGQTVHVANLGDGPVETRVTVVAGRDEPQETFTFEVDARSTYSLLTGDVLATPEPGVLVETFGGDTFVEHTLDDGDDSATAPCADTAAREWYFAVGSTAQGAAQHLELLNTFGEDASVDISFVTETGYAQPERLQGFTVPRRSRVTLSVEDEIGRADLVATRVLVRAGRVVAEQTLALDGSDTVALRSGLALSAGATTLAREWIFPWGGIPGGVADTIAVANFGTESGELTISIALDGEATLEDQTIPVPPRTVTLVDVSTRVPAELGSSVVLRTSPGLAVVAEQLVASGGGGIATMVGITRPAERWVVGADSGADETLVVFNPGEEGVEVSVRDVEGEELADVELAAGERAEIGGDDLAGAPGPFVVEGSGPIAVARVGELTVASGVVVP